MSTTQFVEMYHPALGNQRARVAQQAVDDQQARGWLLVDPGVTPPPIAPYLTQEAGDSRYAKVGEGGGTTPDATSSVAGKVRLAGDLGGTAAAPTVPGLSGKVTAAQVATDLGNPASAIGAAGRAAFEPSAVTAAVLYVSASVPDDTANGRSPGRPKKTIQAALDSLPSTGGTIYVEPGTYAPFATSKVNVSIVGLGASGQDGQVGRGAVIIDVPSGSYGAQFSVGAADENYRGPHVRNLHFKGVAGSLAGVYLGRCSNFVLEDIACADFSTGTGVLVGGSPSSQYGEISRPKIFDCQVGIDVVDHNGLRVNGGTIEYYLGGAPVITPSTVGIRVGTGSDTFRAFGTALQFLETCIDLLGSESHELHGLRCEAFTQAIRNASLRTAIYGGTFNNLITGSGGLALLNLAAADRTTFFPASLGALANPAYTDAGTNSVILADRILTLPVGGRLNLGDAAVVRNAAGQWLFTSSINAGTHVTVDRNSTSGQLFFGGAQDVGLRRITAGVVGIGTGTAMQLKIYTTATRPSASLAQGMAILDGTLNKVLISDASGNWRDALGTIV